MPQTFNYQTFLRDHFKFAKTLSNIPKTKKEKKNSFVKNWDLLILKGTFYMSIPANIIY